MFPGYQKEVSTTYFRGSTAQFPHQTTTSSSTLKQRTSTQKQSFVSTKTVYNIVTKYQTKPISRPKTSCMAEPHAPVTAIEFPSILHLGGVFCVELWHNRLPVYLGRGSWAFWQDLTWRDGFNVRNMNQIKATQEDVASVRNMMIFFCTAHLFFYLCDSDV